ncbi:acyl-CoA dehydrogenase family protein [Acinetobacter bohemicus]|uniref:acyl-CoA dehydrogenase family protein n=1 Tax=Acinetobacter TaxID=469 RepID=UPI00157D179A|nr:MULTISPECIES: acyl-CoA dehydrogenase family protein [Acinetobacter]MCO8043026.1 acyl-CoA dehydrogenase family protein [Acinetobacter sp. S4400-12]MCU7225356.1 acyl-CoA dehydrogenase family protein [Acinetobacter bohemicus]MDM1781250.1 acyl-CoA dehydrogenase family protein [Acinetobacter indicus]QKQ70328.1 acyl-CoA dehydrogenase [Acinetobacter sp. 10FS3-1]
MQFTEEQQLIQDMAKSFAQEQIKPFASEWDQKGIFPKQTLSQMGELGFLGMLIPEEWGGSGTGTLAYVLALEEVAAADGATSAIMSVHNSVGCVPILKFGTEQQKQQFLKPLAQGEMIGAFALTEPHTGSDAAAIKTRAVKDGDHYIINGAKQFITSGHNAGMIIVFAVTDPDAGKKGMSAFLIPRDTPGYEVIRVEEKLGLHASDTCQIALTDVRIHESLRLGAEGEGLKIALANLEGGRIGIAAQAVGLARAALEEATVYAHDRMAFGKPIFEQQAIAFRLASMATEIEAARQLVHFAARKKEAGESCLTEASMAKLFASEMAERVCSKALQIFGGYGYLKDFPIERIYRDARICQIYEGTSDIQRLVIARSL